MGKCMGSLWVSVWVSLGMIAGVEASVEAATVTLVGDSLAKGVGEAGRVETVAVTGYGIDQVQKLVTLGKPMGKAGTVWVSVGTNDYYRGYSTGAYIERLDKLDDSLHSLGYSKVCYLIPAVMPSRVESGLYSIRRALNSRGCTMAMPEQYRAKDGIHYSLSGYTNIFKLTVDFKN